MRLRDFAAGAAATLIVLGASAAVTARPAKKPRVSKPASAPPLQTVEESPDKSLSYLSLSPADFSPNHPTPGASHYATSPYAGATTSKSLVPIHLPAKAKIRELSCYGLRDDDDGREIRFELIRLDLMSTAKEDKLVDLEDNLAGSLEAIVADGLNIRIDNFRYGYFLRYSGPSKMRLRGCRIGYTG